ncbi:hypothetical protein AVEN_122043-1 [Araneus ventricosus]|uniref:Uncharacterized protein n=1 Tax=Araneus ventricosus TaxID=182803 RepID=A0A4Y2F298_ARAVE|nr:hypothetical protein AVEN_122043-1 [Araneus ventricosus]
MHCFVPIANSIEGSKTDFCHWEKRFPLRQMKRAELVSSPRRAGSKGLFKLEIWRDGRRGWRNQVRVRFGEPRLKFSRPRILKSIYQAEKLLDRALSRERQPTFG